MINSYKHLKVIEQPTLAQFWLLLSSFPLGGACHISFFLCFWRN